MDFNQTSSISVSTSPSVTLEIVKNPWFFFNFTSHIFVLKKISDGQWDIVFCPDIDQSRKNIIEYGILDGPKIDGNSVRYEGKSSTGQISFEVLCNCIPERNNTKLRIDWKMSINIDFYERFRGRNFSLDPEHFVDKHLGLSFKNMIELITFKDKGKEFLLEIINSSGLEAIPKIKDYAAKIKNCVILGTSKSMTFIIVVENGEMKSIRAESGNKQTFGGDGILEILNHQEIFSIGIYLPESSSRVNELLDKQKSMEIK